MTQAWMSGTARSANALPNRRDVLLWVPCFFALTGHCKAQQQRGGGAVTELSTLEAEFAQAVRSEREDYTAARRAILERGPVTMPFLQSQRSSPDWKTSLAAAILMGWLTKSEKYKLCTDAVLGKVEGPQPITGRASVKSRVAQVSSLGIEITPRLLEMALKTKEIGDDYAQAAAIFGALIALKDQRTVLPLIDVMKTSGDPSLREWAASTLGPLQDLRASDSLLALLRDQRSPDMLRASAAVSLGTLHVSEAIPDLRAIAADTKLDLGFRKAAIGAIAELQDAGSATGLLRALSGTADLSFRLYLIGVVGDVGTANVLPALKQIELHDPEEPVRMYAREARERIEDRIGSK